MSFIAKGIKKVFKAVKKVVKKVWKPVLIGAAIFFTAGLVAGGFGAFAGVNSVGSFFSAVGTTISTGFQATMATLGFGEGVSAANAAAMGNPGMQGASLFSGAATTSAGEAMASTMSSAGENAAVANVAGNTARDSAAKFLTSKVGGNGGMGGMAKAMLTGQIISGAANGLAANEAAKEREQEREWQRTNTGYAGINSYNDPAGGGEVVDANYNRRPVLTPEMMSSINNGGMVAMNQNPNPWLASILQEDQTNSPYNFQAPQGYAPTG